MRLGNAASLVSPAAISSGMPCVKPVWKTVRTAARASLARAEARIGFQRLLARLDDFRLVDPGALSYIESFIVRGLKALPIRFRPR